jgi:hypothetical protein
MKLDPVIHIVMHLVCFSKTRCDRILMIIMVDNSDIMVFDSLRKDPSQYRTSFIIFPQSLKKFVAENQ